MPILPPNPYFTPAAFVACLASVAYAQPAEEQHDLYASSRQLLWLVHSAHVYAQKNGGQLPPDLAAIVPYVAKDGQSTRETIRTSFLAPGETSIDIPANADPSWVNQHSSYTYLGKPGVALSDVPQWGEVVLAHIRLDLGHPALANPNETLYAVAFTHGAVAVMTHDGAIATINESRRVFEALSTGAPLPEAFQAVSDLSSVHQAIREYAKAHAGELPPDLGSTLAYVKPTNCLRTPAQRASIYLSPRVKSNLYVPDEPTPEWVNRNSSYVYLGAGGVKLAELEDPQHAILLHTRPEEPIPPSPQGSPPGELMGVCSVRGDVERVPRHYSNWVIPYSKQIIESARSGTPLPDTAHAMRDIRVILKAITGYANANDGQLPPDLASTLEFLPDEPFLAGGPQARARVYLSPKAERISTPPEDAGPEWVRAHGNYRYLGNENLRLADLRRGGVDIVILVHAPLGEEFSMMSVHIPEPRAIVPWGHSSGGGVWLFAVDGFEDQLARAREVLTGLSKPGTDK